MAVLKTFGQCWKYAVKVINKDCRETEVADCLV